MEVRKEIKKEKREGKKER